MSYIKYYVFATFLLTVGTASVISAPDRTTSETTETERTASDSNVENSHISNNSELIQKMNGIEGQIKQIAEGFSELKNLKKDIEELKIIVNNVSKLIKQNKTTDVQQTETIQSVVPVFSAKATDATGNILGTVSGLGNQIASNSFNKIKATTRSVASNIGEVAQTSKNKINDIAGSVTSKASGLVQNGQNIAGNLVQSITTKASSISQASHNVAKDKTPSIIAKASGTIQANNNTSGSVVSSILGNTSLPTQTAKNVANGTPNMAVNVNSLDNLLE